MKEIEKFHEDLILWVGAGVEQSSMIRNVFEGEVARIWMKWPISWQDKLGQAAIIIKASNPRFAYQMHLDFWGDDNASR